MNGLTQSEVADSIDAILGRMSPSEKRRLRGNPDVREEGSMLFLLAESLASGRSSVNQRLRGLAADIKGRIDEANKTRHSWRPYNLNGKERVTFISILLGVPEAQGQKLMDRIGHDINRLSGEAGMRQLPKLIFSDEATADSGTFEIVTPEEQAAVLV